MDPFPRMNRGTLRDRGRLNRGVYLEVVVEVKIVYVLDHSNVALILLLKVKMPSFHKQDILNS